MKKVLFILGELADSDIEWLIKKGRRKQVKSGTVLVQEGKQIESLYIVLDGSFSITVKALKNREVARIGTGEKNRSDGLGMLVEQAAESFYIWRGVKPETKSVIEKVRSEL